jgi:hypothetical protein
MRIQQYRIEREFLLIGKPRKAHEQSAQETPEPTEKQPAQIYDSVMKELVQERIADLVPVLLKGAVYEDRIDVEQIRPTMRVDRVYRIRYRNRPHILHLEFESNQSDLEDMASRLHTYHAILHQDYKLPVISMLIYPFRVAKMLSSPWEEKSGDEALVTFKFVVLPLFMLEADEYVREHVECMYPFLPTMHGANAELIGQVIDELEQLYRDDQVTLTKLFIWMQVFLDRTDTVSLEARKAVYKKLSTYNHLWAENPTIKQMLAEREVKARAEGEIKGEIKGERKAIITIIQARFPALLELAQECIEQIDSGEKLMQLTAQLATAPDEAAARWALSADLPGKSVGQG